MSGNYRESSSVSWKAGERRGKVFERWYSELSTAVAPTVLSLSCSIQKILCGPERSSETFTGRTAVMNLSRHTAFCVRSAVILLKLF